jgi:cob(I)alamin adenosyltransferase
MHTIGYLGSQAMPEEKPFPWYTGAGDDGVTSLLGDARVPKYDLQPEAFGTVDEASAALGLARAFSQIGAVQDVLLTIQRDLYHVMTELAATREAASRFQSLQHDRVDWLETQTDEFGSRIAMPREFVVPGDTQAGACLDLARAIVRRAERVVVKLCAEGLCHNPAVVPYLNRLSSLCFVLARLEDQVGRQGPITLAKDVD